MRSTPRAARSSRGAAAIEAVLVGQLSAVLFPIVIVFLAALLVLPGAGAAGADAVCLCPILIGVVLCIPILAKGVVELVGQLVEGAGQVRQRVLDTASDAADDILADLHPVGAHDLGDDCGHYFIRRVNQIAQHADKATDQFAQQVCAGGQEIISVRPDLGHKGGHGLDARLCDRGESIKDPVCQIGDDLAAALHDQGHIVLQICGKVLRGRSGLRGNIRDLFCKFCSETKHHIGCSTLHPGNAVFAEAIRQRGHGLRNVWQHLGAHRVFEAGADGGQILQGVLECSRSSNALVAHHPAEFVDRLFHNGSVLCGGVEQRAQLASSLAQQGGRNGGAFCTLIHALQTGDYRVQDFLAGHGCHLIHAQAYSLKSCHLILGAGCDRVGQGFHAALEGINGRATVPQNGLPLLISLCAQPQLLALLVDGIANRRNVIRKGKNGSTGTGNAGSHSRGHLCSAGDGFAEGLLQFLNLGVCFA